MAKVLDGTAAWTVGGDISHHQMQRYTKCLVQNCTEGNPTLGSCEMNDVSIRLEHVNLLNCLDGLNVDLL